MRAAGPGQSALLALDVIDVLNRLRLPFLKELVGRYGTEALQRLESLLRERTP